MKKKNNTIISITEEEWNFSRFEGFLIETTKGQIKVGIDKKCGCGRAGYFITNNDINDFIGGKIVDIKVVDGCINVQKLEKIAPFINGDVLFVNIETDRGVLQFTVYNQGKYCAHKAFVCSDIIAHEMWI